MNEENEQFEIEEMEEEKICVQATPIMPESSAKNYVQPSFSKVAMEIEAEDETFIPEISEDGSAKLRADLSDYEREFVSLAYRTTVEIDCGFSVDIPSGYRAVVNSIPSMASRGLVVTNSPNVEGRVKVYLTNVGKQIVTVSHGDTFAQMTLHPVYGFEWLT